MTFWDRVLLVADMGDAFIWVVVLLPLAAMTLFVLVPKERSQIRTAGVLFALSLGGIVAAAALFSPDAPMQSILYRWLRWMALFAESVAIITVGSVLLFDVALKAVSLTPPRIMRDLMVALAYVVIAIMLLSRNGVDLTGIVATSAVVTAVIGFSLQDTLETSWEEWRSRWSARSSSEIGSASISWKDGSPRFDGGKLRSRLATGTPS